MDTQRKLRMMIAEGDWFAEIATSPLRVAALKEALYALQFKEQIRDVCATVQNGGSLDRGTSGLTFGGDKCKSCPFWIADRHMCMVWHDPFAASHGSEQLQLPL